MIFDYVRGHTARRTLGYIDKKVKEGVINPTVKAQMVQLLQKSRQQAASPAQEAATAR